MVEKQEGVSLCQSAPFHQVTACSAESGMASGSPTPCAGMETMSARCACYALKIAARTGYLACTSRKHTATRASGVR